mmetsp:Transcript_21455/g.49981  ORF Transcript_21455/g.49981 Transcript_21455/m.49981 type:complete len:204 (-) Transcript_21455:848-1459(-)
MSLRSTPPAVSGKPPFTGGQTTKPQRAQGCGGGSRIHASCSGVPGCGGDSSTTNIQLVVKARSLELPWRVPLSFRSIVSYVEAADFANSAGLALPPSGAVGGGIAISMCGKGKTGSVSASFSRKQRSMRNSRGKRKFDPWHPRGNGSTCRCVSKGCLNSVPVQIADHVATPPTCDNSSKAAMKSARLKSSWTSVRIRCGGTPS